MLNVWQGVYIECDNGTENFKKQQSNFSKSRIIKRH